MPTVTKPMPKPAGHKRSDKSVKIDQVLAKRAKIIAETRGVTIAEYLSELLRPHIERDWPKALKELGNQS